MFVNFAILYSFFYFNWKTLSAENKHLYKTKVKAKRENLSGSDCSCLIVFSLVENFKSLRLQTLQKCQLKN